MIDLSMSTVPVKGWTTNCQDLTFPDLDMLSTPPTTSPANGVWQGGQGGVTAPYRIKVFPYAEGTPGSRFRMRICGLDNIGVDPYAQVWWPYLLAEFTCTVCNRGGPPAAVPGRETGRLIRESERMCDTIELTGGSLGVSQVAGVVNSTGPGTNLIAWAMVDLAGCRKFQFSFEQIDTVTMNVLFARA